tara:strand:- start:251 stop:445 length:195 start_codon:yes stop_codon:yes gene_type:complete
VGQQGDKMKPLLKKKILRQLDDCIDHLVGVISRDEYGDLAHELADVIAKLRNIIKEMLYETPKK